MRRSQWAGLGSRSLAVRLGVLCMVGLGLAVVRSLVAADASSGLGAGVYPAAYAIKGAKVVAAPGKVIEPGTIVVRRGVIEAVGPDKDVDGPLRRRDDRRQRAWSSIPGSSTCTRRSASTPGPSGRRPARAGRSTWPRRP